MEREIKYQSLEDLVDDLFNKSQRNSFYKKEVFLIGSMVTLMLLLLFYQNGWNNKITFITAFVVIIVTCLKLLQIFNERISNYNKFIFRLKKDDFKVSESKDILYNQITIKGNADERITKLKDYNYSFKAELNELDEIQISPNYKRQGIDLKEQKQENLRHFLSTVFRVYIEDSSLNKTTISLKQHLKYYMDKPEFRNLDAIEKSIYEKLIRAISLSENTKIND